MADDSVLVDVIRRGADNNARLARDVYAQILSGAMDAIIVTDSREQIVVFNEAAERMFLYPAAEAIGRPISILIPLRFHQIHSAHMQDFGKSRIAKRTMGNSKPLPAIRANGEEFLIEASISLVQSDGEQLFAVIARDVSNRLRSEEDAQRLATELQSTNQTLREQMQQRHAAETALLAAHQELRLRAADMERSTSVKKHLSEMGEFLQACVTSAEASHVAEQSLQTLFPRSSGIVYLNREFGGLVEAFAKWNSAGLTSNETLEADACWGLRRGRPHVVRLANATAKCEHLQDAREGTSMCIPMIAQGQPLGLFHMIWIDDDDTPHSPSLESLENLAVSAAESLALAIANVKLREKLREQSIRDPLTQLYNRRYFEDALYREISRSRRTGAPVGIIMIDIDNFKQFNDSCGHPVGDKLLRALGTYLRSHVRPEDVPARYGGEEFSLILPGAPCEIVRARAEMLRRGAHSVAMDSGGGEQSNGCISISCGVAIFPDHGTNPHELLQSADKALYEAKRGGKDRVVVSDSRINKDSAQVEPQTV